MVGKTPLDPRYPGIFLGVGSPAPRFLTVTSSASFEKPGALPWKYPCAAVGESRGVNEGLTTNRLPLLV